MSKRYFKSPKLKYIFLTSIFLCFTQTIFASNIPDYYSEPGTNPFRDYQLGEMSELIDPFGGGLMLRFIDVVVPGNGGMDVVVQRSYRSLQGQAGVLGYPYLPGRSLLGVGWDMHFGRIWYDGSLSSEYVDGCKTDVVSSANNPILELPDGTRQVLVDSDFGNNYAFITKQRWIGKCRSETVGGGLEVVSPDGVKYTFDKLGRVGGQQAWSATRIEDANGNYIAIEYSTSTKAQHNIIKNVYTREFPTTPVVSFTYLDEDLWGARIRTVTAYNQTWTYNYKNVVDNGLTISDEYYLESVTPPAGSNWSFTYNENSSANNAGLYSIKSVMSPGGTTTNYTYKYVNFDGAFIRTAAIETKSISGGGVQSGTWTYVYTPSNGTANDETTITFPGGRYEYEHFGSRQASNGSVWKIGSLVEKRAFNADNTLVQTETYEWEPDQLSTQNELHRRIDTVVDNFTYVPRLLSQTTSRDDTNAASTYKTTYANYDAFGNPGTITEQNDANQRVTTNTYTVLASPWIIHLIDSETISGVAGNIDRTYDANGNLTSVSEYGALTQYEYDGQGNLTKLTTPRGIATHYSDYKRGTARLEERGVVNDDYQYTRRVVNDNGTIASEEHGSSKFITSYQYDDLLRVDYIATPSLTDADVDIIWNQGGTQRTVVRGTFTGITTYDGLGRMIDVSAEGVSNSFDYDSLGRRIFVYYPNSIKDGDRYTYDVLDRVKSITHTVDNSGIQFDYLSGNRERVTNERGYATTKTYLSYGNPGQRFLTTIEAPEGVTIDIGRDKLGNIDYVSRGGLVRDYGYNAMYYLTSISHPELGADADQGVYYERDAEGNMISRRVGSAGSEISYSYDSFNRISDINYKDASTPNVEFKYDARGNIFLASNGELTWNYDFTENNKLRREELTIASPVNKSFVIQYQRNEQDSLASITYPNGLTVDFNPDDLGRPRQALRTDDKASYVSSISYYPDGKTQSITHGNGVTTEYGEDGRRRISTINASNQLVDLAYGYGLSNNITSIDDGINSLAGFPTVASTPGLGYDGLDRLTTVMGSAAFGYDARGNINTMTLGGNKFSYVYDSRNRLDSVSGSYHDFLYDDEGNVISNGLDSFVYDRASHLTSVPSRNIQNYFDGHGMLAVQTRDGKNTVTMYNLDGQLLYEENDITEINYIRVGNQLVAKAERCNPTLTDSDGDGIPDCIEIQNGLDPNSIDDGLADSDEDGLSNAEEYNLGADMFNSDTDGDGMTDGYEFYNGLSLTTNDAAGNLDNDGLTNIEEFQLGTAANNPDTDDDGVTDGDEVAQGRNPLFNEALLVPLIMLILN